MQTELGQLHFTHQEFKTFRVDWLLFRVFSGWSLLGSKNLTHEHTRSKKTKKHESH